MDWVREGGCICGLGEGRWVGGLGKVCGWACGVLVGMWCICEWAGGCGARGVGVRVMFGGWV